MQYKQLAIEGLKADDDARTIEGFASVFGNVDSQNDIVMPGAFKKSIKASLPAMLWQHKDDQPIGVWNDMHETDHGLYVKGTIVDTALGNDAYKLAKAGALKGMSIGYGAKEYTIDKKTGARQLRELVLHEVSLVTFPANERAQITRVKSENGTFMTEREFEEFLRDVGNLSPKEAKTVVSKGYRALAQRDVGAEELSTEQMAELSALFSRIKPLTK